MPIFKQGRKTKYYGCDADLGLTLIDFLLKMHVEIEILMIDKV